MSIHTSIPERSELRTAIGFLASGWVFAALLLFTIESVPDVLRGPVESNLVLLALLVFACCIPAVVSFESAVPAALAATVLALPPALVFGVCWFGYKFVSAAVSGNAGPTDRQKRYAAALGVSSAGSKKDVSNRIAKKAGGYHWK